MSIDLGDPVTRTLTVQVGNVLTDPTAITFTYRDPAGVDTPLVPTRTSVGLFTVTFTPTLAGSYRYRWLTTGIGAGSESGAVQVRDPWALAVSLDDVKTFENKLNNVDDDELRDFIEAAQAILAVRIGPLVPVTVTETQDGGSSSLVLRKWPVISVTGISYATGQTVLATDLDLDPDTGIVFWRYNTVGVFLRGPRFLTVTYLAGRLVLTADLREALLELIKHLWESQTGGNRRPNFAADGTNAQTASSYLLPYRVESLIKPYLAPRIG